MVELIRGLDPGAIRRALSEVHDQILAAGRDPNDVEVLAATKYVALEELPALAEAGLTLAGESRAQDLEAKASAYPQFTWDFIGNLQSRKVRSILPYVRYVHSVATDSVLAQLGRHAGRAGTNIKVLVEVNVSGELGKGGVAPADLGGFIARCPVEVIGLMTMPPLASDPEQSRPYFAALRALAVTHGLSQLSMGTSQDYPVALAEGATIIRLGSSLYRRSEP
ncbi:MAG: YggS family pyridoxal phosphate enzyme [Solirubrobacteraceae bacterium]